MKRAFVLWQMILVCVDRKHTSSVFAQQTGYHHCTLRYTKPIRFLMLRSLPTSTGMFLPEPERTIDLAITGGGRDTVGKDHGNPSFNQPPMPIFSPERARSILSQDFTGVFQSIPLHFQIHPQKRLRSAFDFQLKNRGPMYLPDFLFDAALLLTDNTEQTPKRFRPTSRSIRGSNRTTGIPSGR